MDRRTMLGAAGLAALGSVIGPGSALSATGTRRIMALSASGTQDVRIIPPLGSSYQQSVGPSAPVELWRGSTEEYLRLIVQNLGTQNIEIKAEDDLNSAYFTIGQGVVIPGRHQLAGGLLTALGASQSGGSSGFYYDRNPLSIRMVLPLTFLSTAQGSANPATYQVPPNRKAYVEVFDLICGISIAFTTDNALIHTYINLTPPPGSGDPVVTLLDALIWHGTAAGTMSQKTLGANMELQPGEVISGNGSNGRPVADPGISFHQVSMKATEFDG